MAVITLTSVSGSPGVSTAALALGVHWPRPVVVIEADTNAVTSAMPGFFRSNLLPELGGIDKVQLAYSRGVLTREDLLDPERFLAIAVHELPPIKSAPIPAIPPGHKLWVVPGFFHLGIADGVSGLWVRLPELLRSLSEAGIDVIIDLGRLGRDDVRMPLIDTSDQVLICANATMVDLNRVYRRLEGPDLTQRVGVSVGSAEKFFLLLNEVPAEQIPAVDFANNTLPVLAMLPFDPQGAATFSVGRPDPKPNRNTYRQKIRSVIAGLGTIIGYSDLDRSAS
ncbi:hypothetical protein G3N18_02020 [Microbacterium sp. 2C]|uniref:hypothetical protein n=1 Tax=Microbacterium paulum TaxID=2707006 RepID=UPI0018C327FF|nr:hypothetical protein [Microbacterium paulum]MBG0716864.1 hypothetical protein [Microbacterium paulum]